MARVMMSIIGVTMLSSTTGCTLIGLGIGSAVPQRETILDVGPPPAGAAIVETDAQISPGATVRIPNASRSNEWKATYLGVYGQYVFVASNDPPDPDVAVRNGSYGDKENWAIPRERVRAVREEKRSSYWLHGLLVGATIDVLVTVITVGVLASSGCCGPK